MTHTPASKGKIDARNTLARHHAGMTLSTTATGISIRDHAAAEPANVLAVKRTKMLTSALMTRRTDASGIARNRLALGNRIGAASTPVKHLAHSTKKNNVFGLVTLASPLPEVE